jgi:type IV pilus assembly protein PilN
MMIRINLLPTRQVKKRSQSSQALALLAAALLLALLGNVLWTTSRSETSDELARRNASLQQQIEEKKRVIKEVEAIRERRDDVNRKLAVLKGLRDGRTGPVRLMDALSSATPKEVWLTEFTQNPGDGTVQLKGRAITNDDVAELMRGLGNVVWTPKGLGRLVEQQRAGAKTSRVELMALEGGVIEEFPVSEIKTFFSNIDLKRSESRLDSQQKGSSPGGGRVVEFELAMSASYAS